MKKKLIPDKEKFIVNKLHFYEILSEIVRMTPFPKKKRKPRGRKNSKVLKAAPPYR